MTSDDELMQAIALGDRRAFASLFERHSGKVLGYAARLLGDRNRAEDISQDVWIKVVKIAPNYKAQSGFSAWVLTITRHACIDLLRSSKRLVSMPEDFDAEDTSRASVLEVLGGADDVTRVQREIALLPDSQRAALVLWMTEDVTYDEISSQLGVSVSSVKSLLFRARETLALKLRGDS